MRRLVVATGVIVALGVIGVISWFAVDEATTRDEVSPNVTYDGVAMRRAPISDVGGIVDARADQILDTPIVIRTPDGQIDTTAGELGLTVDRESTVEAVVSAGRTGSFAERLWSWLRAPWRPRQVDTQWSWPAEIATERVAELPGAEIALPVEPTVEITSEHINVVPGVEGISVEPRTTADRIMAMFEPAQQVTIEAEVIVTPPIDSDERANALAEHLDSITGGGLTVRVLGAVGRLSEPTLRDALIVQGPVSDPEIAFRRDLLQEALVGLFNNLSRAGTDPTFDIQDGEPVLIEEGSAPQGCCAPGAGQAIIEALEAGDNGPVDLPPAPVGDPTLEAWARGDGIVEVVGEFTTQHNCCESRVNNIHRIADLIRGQYLLPGESFSVNGFVGERTVEKGFVGAGVIEQGRFTEDVGGGISQFATTFFNAAFFAGLDLDEYQSHSIYISRYPYGREATLSFPKPDLVVTNTTEYPVLVWPTYTDTSITVSIYSTAHIEVEETGQEERPARRCTQVETFRSRTYPDGSVVEDSVIALYRPGEGLDCNGNPTPIRP